jgi:hypothetical protein
MVKANLKDGRTLTFDLASEVGSAEWQALQADPTFQSQVTGLGVHWDGELYMFPLPKTFLRLAFSAELLRDRKGAIIGERIGCQADDILGTLTVYFSAVPKLARYDLRRIGRPRFLSRGRPWPQTHRDD